MSKIAEVIVSEMGKHLQTLIDDLAALRAKELLEDSRARVAVLEELVRTMPTKDDGEKAARLWLVRRGEVLYASTTSATPGEAWRAMVEALEVAAGQFERMDHDDLDKSNCSRCIIEESVGAALAAAKAVMGG